VSVPVPGAPFKPSFGLSGEVPQPGKVSLPPGAPFKPSFGLSGEVQTSRVHHLQPHHLLKRMEIPVPVK
jgi:hypothetical protein